MQVRVLPEVLRSTPPSVVADPTHRSTKAAVQVRLLAEGPRPSRLAGQGHRPLTSVTRVRLPRGTLSRTQVAERDSHRIPLGRSGSRPAGRRRSPPKRDAPGSTPGESTIAV